MKKTLTFLFAAAIAVLTSFTAFANNVILKNNSSYEVNIDGRTYNGNNTYNISDLGSGNHVVSVYRITSNGGIFGRKTRTLIDSEQFYTDQNQVSISVNQSGQIYVNRGNNTGGNNGDWNNGSGKRYGKSEGKGKGNKYGHYKNKGKKSCDDDRQN